MNLKTKYLGQKHLHYKIIDSTQKEVWKRFKDEKKGFLVSSDIQTSGIGTHGRTWHTESPNNIAFSFLLKPNCSPNKIENLPLDIAKIICEILANTYKINVDIKKPNDLILNNKKLGGILVESKCQGDIIEGVVVGIGINICEENFSEDIKDIATSIKKELKVTINSEEFIEIFCNTFETFLERKFNL